MWEKQIFGSDFYHVLMWFIIYSVMGWIVESIYMSFCNKKLTNRGFARGPACPIYGVGALTVYFILRQYSHNVILLYFLGTILATSIELFTAIIMKKFFGEIWWDYTEKPYNYKGIICLESSIAWGFYTIFLFLFLQKGVMMMVERIPLMVGRLIGGIFVLLYLLDFMTSLLHAKDIDLEKRAEWIRRRFDQIQKKLVDTKDNVQAFLTGR